MRQIWETPGGIHPEQNKHQSTGEQIGTIAMPPEIILPMGQHIGAPATPIVEVGQTVLKGECVAKPEGFFSAAIHASTSGTISAIEERTITHPSGMRALCVIIKPDGKDTWAPLNPCDDYTQLSKDEILERIRNAGIVGMGGAGFPTAIKANPKSNRKITTLILNGTECEPYITADDMLMRERADEILLGAQLFCHLLTDVNEILIGIEDNKPEAIAAMQAAANALNDERIHVVSFPTKYPSGGEKQLIQILTGKEIPSGGLPAQLGIVVQNIGTAVACHRAIVHGEPLISRVTTVVGQTLEKQRNINVLMGTPIGFVLQEHGFVSDYKQRIIVGGPMMGFAADNQNVPIIKTTNCILAPSTKELPLPAPAQPCIRCGMCEQACPASLLPQQLYWFSRSEDVEKLEEHNLFDCIECGACSYVCPSNIPLVQYYRASKGTIKLQREEKAKSDHARLRFEQRQERIVKAEAEKEAKREARKQAALEAKKLMAEKAAQPANGETENTTNAVDKTASKVVDPVTQKAKLTRALTSAQSRLERANAQLQTNIDEDNGSRKDALQSKIKQAELKVNDAQNKLDAFNKEHDISSSEPGTPQAKNSSAPSNDKGKDATSPALKKMAMSDAEKQAAAVASIEKRLGVATQKYKEAQEANTPTADALKLGVEKLEQKLSDAKAVLAQQANDVSANTTQPVSKNEADAALGAIERAQAKAKAKAAMTDDEKKQDQIASLKKRIDKAKTRLNKAKDENDDNIAAFENAYNKLQDKLTQIS